LESLEPVWLFGAMALVAGTLLGVLITRLLSPASADVDKLVADLELERAEMKSYKASVNTHFDETSNLVSELTQDYVKVYRHLAQGAQTLSNTREFSQVLEQPQGRVLISVVDESAVPESVTDEPAAEAISEEPPADYVEAQADEDEKVADGEVADGEVADGEVADDDAGKKEPTVDPDAGTEEVATTGDVPAGDVQNETVAEFDHSRDHSRDDARDDAREDESTLNTTDPGHQAQADSTEPESTEPDSTRKT
jgi:uncharacterized membrane-anchored protein YhcB (DUF1043 family)